MVAASSKKETKKSRINYPLLQEKLEKAVEKSIPKNEIVGVAFSAGIDSGTIAQVVRKFSKKAILLTVGVKGSVDISRAEPFAKKWKIKWVKKILTPTEINENYLLAGKILHTNDRLQQTLGAVNVSIAKLARENGIKTVFVGSGADE
ncbi:MAG: asparagine synthase-related protein, partial [archaeon]